MHQLLSLLRVIGNRMKFLSLSIKKGCNVNCKGECTARLNNEWSAQKGSTINIGKHLSSLGHWRYQLSYRNIEVKNESIDCYK